MEKPSFVNDSLMGRVRKMCKGNEATTLTALKWTESLCWNGVIVSALCWVRSEVWCFLAIAIICSVVRLRRAWRGRFLKSFGWGGMTGEMYNTVWRATPSHFQCLYDCCLRGEYFPQFWMTARAVVLLKSPEKDRANSWSYTTVKSLRV